MNTEAFTKAYYESRNGANFFVRHPLVRKFTYSDGVKDCAEAGTYWLLDIAATELPQLCPVGALGVLTVTAGDNKALLKLELDDGVPPVWTRKLDFTDMPDGVWSFYIVNEGERIAFILPTEY